MSNKITCSFLIVLLSIACKTQKTREIIIGDEKIQGIIGKDSVFNGLIRFYDKTTNRLKAEANYLKGKLNGEMNEYYKNGFLSTKSNYENDKVIGPTIIYDERGNKIKSENYYYDIQVGESIKYENEKVATYHFFSFSGESLFSINYDASRKARITDIQTNYFFLNKREYADVSFDGIGPHYEEIFIYTPNPPLYNFRYSLVMVDPQFSQVKLVREFNNMKPWTVFTIDANSKMDKDMSYAIKLVINDSISGGDVVMYKRL